MSTDNNEAADEMSRCASCGTTENDDIKLRKCTACQLVRYCGVKCQKEHWKKHKKECRKRATELRDELLFKQPEGSHLGDCPICFIPLPLKSEKAVMMPCCSKVVCEGCNYASQKRDAEEGLEIKCPFCRHTAPKLRVELDRILMKRIEKNDPVALQFVGTEHNVKGDYKSAFEYWTKAAELGDALAHYQLSCFYSEGKGVEKDEKKERYHLEQAAIGGHPEARYYLGLFELKDGRVAHVDRALNHWIIGANLGDDKSFEHVKKFYQGGVALDFAAVLRAYQAAVDAMKSPHREAAEGDREWKDRVLM